MPFTTIYPLSSGSAHLPRSRTWLAQSPSCSSGACSIYSGSGPPRREGRRDRRAPPSADGASSGLTVIGSVTRRSSRQPGQDQIRAHRLLRALATRGAGAKTRTAQRWYSTMWQAQSCTMASVLGCRQLGRRQTTSRCVGRLVCDVTGVVSSKREKHRAELHGGRLLVRSFSLWLPRIGMPTSRPYRPS